MTGQRATATILLGLLLGPALAQEPPAPGAAGPETGAPETRVPETKAERQRNNAAKLAGLVGFVRTHCADLKPDDERFRTVLGSLGVAPKDLEAGDLHLRALAYAEVYAKDVPANCARATENFGVNGRTIPGLVVTR